MIHLADLRRALAAHVPQVVEGTDKTRAAVAVVLCQDSDGLRLLFIERARHEGDPWSGHIAFPGGRLEEGDSDLRRTAERETLEEIGLDLGGAGYLGRLDDLTGATLPVLVSAFAYAVEEPCRFRLSAEVRHAFWCALEDLLDPKRHGEHTFQWRGRQRRLPAIDLLGPGRPLLWGITYRFTARLLELAGHGLPSASQAALDVDQQDQGQ
jgi:8-oxo-dGTP pyrophosphatase MutT (NUDIX family)